MIDVGIVNSGSYVATIAYGWDLAETFTVGAGTMIDIEINSSPNSNLRGSGVQDVELLTEAGNSLAAESGNFLAMG